MPRPYSERLLVALSKATGDERPGILLAKACVAANVPMPLVAKHLGVTKLTVFTWFRGGNIREFRVPAVTDLTLKLKRDLKAKVLPAKSLAEAAVYFKNLK